MKRACLGVVFLVLLLPICYCVYRTMNRDSVKYSVYSGRLDSSVYVPNNAQNQSSVWLGSYAGQLYIYPQCKYSSKATKYNEWLCALTAEGIVKVSKLGHNSQVQIVGYDDGFLYYWSCDGAGDDSLYCYDIESSEEILLAAKERMLPDVSITAEDGSFYIPIYDTADQQAFLHVLEGKVISITNEQMHYSSGKLNCYTTTSEQRYIQRVVVLDENNTEYEIKLDTARSKTVLPCSQGILVHNMGHSQLLYLVRSIDDVVCLFEIPCMSSVSAVTIVGDYAFLSVKRYKGYDGILLQRYENDDLEGTYRISLVSHSVQKVSENIYSGLYYFGGDHIFATDEYCNIDVLDLSGEVVDAILTVN